MLINMNHTVNVDLSKEIAKKIKAKKGRSLYTNSIGVIYVDNCKNVDLFKEIEKEMAKMINMKKGRSFYTNSIGVIYVDNCKYVIGYALFRKTDKSFSAIEHGWIERDTEQGKEIIDPSFYIDNLIDSCIGYHGALEFEPVTMAKTIGRNKDNPALQFYGNNYKKMEELQQKLKKNISKDIHFISCEHWRYNTKKNLITEEEVQEIYKFLDKQSQKMYEIKKIFDDLEAFENFPVTEDIELKRRIENDQIEAIIFELTEKFKLSEEQAKFIYEGWLQNRTEVDTDNYLKQ